MRNSHRGPRARYALFMRLLPGVLSALCGLTGCFESKSTEVAGGGGIETTDGQIASASGPIAGARIRLVPEGYNPIVHESFPDSLTAITDAHGNYLLKGVAPGRYNLEALSAADGSRLFLAGLALAPSAHAALPKAVLAPAGRLRLLWEGSHFGYLFIPGTSILRRITAAEIESPVILLDSLPQGTLGPVRWSQSRADTVGIPITDSLPILSDTTIESMVLSAWTHSGIWHIDTSPAGAGVAGDVAAFPLLLRLTAAEFDFSQALPDGGDIRFSGMDRKELPHQVERWDPKAGRAEIWVKVPMAAGNDTTGTFMMHWGNPAAGSHSFGPAVFGGDAGFAAVWHLGGPANTSPAGYLDDSPNGFHGTRTDTATPAADPVDPAFVEGAIAGGQKLDGVSERIVVADGDGLDPTASITVSAWIRLESWKAGNWRVVQKGIGFTQYALAGFGADSLEWRIVVDGVPYPVRAPSSALSPIDEWHLLQGTYDGLQALLYVDGRAVATQNITGALGASKDSLEIGHSPSGPDNQFFQGLLDEITISPLARSADWIKLSFESQRQGSKLLRFEVLK
jgi:hypothetical protein